ncbi:hypothetical protein GCM10017562_00700 [Streptomyces roseofulvus]|uniref:hypothetical protein n=1 Tax=Streptomyces roseofulvus TaxID=33902 RepID=UPI003387470A
MSLGLLLDHRLTRRQSPWPHRRDRRDWHAAAQRNLFNRMIGQIYHCLQKRKLFEELVAFPALPELTVSAA